jgi:cell wall-associated NlpC family hydrolase
MYSNEIKRKAIILAARSYLSVPFSHQGRSICQGFDCVGLICQVLRDIGLKINSHENYIRRPEKGLLLKAALDAGLIKLSSDSLEGNYQYKQGDILLFRLGRRVEHAAFYTDIGILHADEKMKMVVEHGLTESWKKRIFAVLTYPSL